MRDGKYPECMMRGLMGWGGSHYQGELEVVIMEIVDFYGKVFLVLFAYFTVAVFFDADAGVEL